jgi:hypothetical protein
VHVSAASATAATSSVSPPSDPGWAAANANLAYAVKLYQHRLEENETERIRLEKELKAAKAQVAAAENDGAPLRNEYDLTQDDWKELAKTHTVKARFPCRFDPDWHLSQDLAAALGLSPGDAQAVEKAYVGEEARLAQVIGGACTQVLGNAQLAERLGPRACSTIIDDYVKDKGADVQLVADIRAGNVPTPSTDRLDPYAQMLLAQTYAEQFIEADLAKTLGPDDAKRLTFDDELGSCSTSTGGGPPPKRSGR